MKTLTLLLLAGSLYAADAPKPTGPLPEVPVESQLQIRTAQLAVARISDAMGKMAMQYQALEKQAKESQEALEKLVKALPRPAACKDCELSDSDLSWQQPKVAVAKQEFAKEVKK